jgi:hypothetical protein
VLVYDMVEIWVSWWEVYSVSSGRDMVAVVSLVPSQQSFLCFILMRNSICLLTKLQVVVDRRWSVETLNVLAKISLQQLFDVPQTPHQIRTPAALIHMIGPTNNTMRPPSLTSLKAPGTKPQPSQIYNHVDITALGLRRRDIGLWILNTRHRYIHPLLT